MVLISTPWLPGTSLKKLVVPTTGEMVVCSSADQRYTALVSGSAMIVSGLIVEVAVTKNPEVVSKDRSVSCRPEASEANVPLIRGS